MGGGIDVTNNGEGAQAGDINDMRRVQQMRSRSHKRDPVGTNWRVASQIGKQPIITNYAFHSGIHLDKQNAYLANQQSVLALSESP